VNLSQKGPRMSTMGTIAYLAAAGVLVFAERAEGALLLRRRQAAARGCSSRWLRLPLGSWLCSFLSREYPFSVSS
jgi:hypothetical protein